MLKSVGRTRGVHRAISRRSMLRGAGVGLAILNAMGLATARAQTAAVPRRMFAICNNLGLLPGEFFPDKAGPDYTPSNYLKILQDYRKDFTVFSGVSHPNVDGGHPADISFLTAAPHPASSSFRNTISLDQYIAERIGTKTRFPSLTLAVNTGARSLSWTANGVAIPPEQSAAGVFRQMFIQGSPKEVEAKIAELDTGRSILDAVADQVRDLERSVGAADRARLDQYFTSVRELENRLQESKGWERKPKPVVKEPEPQDPTSPAQYMTKAGNMYRLVRLAFETDSTRSVTLMLDSVSTPVVEIKGATIGDGYHNLSHHGKSEAKLAQLRLIDSWHMRLLADLFNGLKGVPENGETLLDRSMILYGSNLGDANAHSTTNMPVLLAGGGFRHAGHLAFDRNQNYPLPNLFVSVLQRMGIGRQVCLFDGHDVWPRHEDSMIRAAAIRFLLLLGAVAYAWTAEEVIVDFENAVPLLADRKANRIPRWEEKGVVFTLAREPQQTKAKGMLMFFTHLSTGHKGIVCAMATEPIPVRATFSKPVSSVTVSFWGSTGTPALLEAFDGDGKVVDRASLESVPNRKAPGDPVPIFPMTVRARSIAYVQFSGPREGEYLAADEVRFTPIDGDRN